MSKVDSFFQKIVSSRSAQALILSNLLVLLFAVLSNLGAVHVLLIYWIEAIIMVFFAELRIIYSKLFYGYKKYSYLSVFLSFLIFSGIYLFYLPFIVILSVPMGVTIKYGDIFSTIFPESNLIYYFIFSCVMLFLSHLFSFKINLTKDVKAMESDYWKKITGRVLMFHVSIVLGIFLGVLLGSLGIGVVLLFVFFKTAYDLYSHLSYHGK